MTKIGVAIGTILLASAAAIMAPQTASAFRGGGGFHGGGGGFHGGGFGGGGFRGGGFSGFRGGSVHMGGTRMGGFRVGANHVGGMRIGHGGNLHSGALSHQGFQGGNRAFHRGAFATRVAPGFSRQAFLHNGFDHFHRFGVFGWVGPLFWPYAFGDIYCDIFWGYWGYGCAAPYWSLAFGDPFWDYGYGDIYGGLFSPFAFTDLAPYLPNGPSSVRQTRSKGAAPASTIAQMCGDDTKEVAGWPIDRIQQLISPDDQQHMALDDLASASVKAAQIIKSGCPTSVAFTPTGRLAAMEQRIEAMAQAVETVRGPLDTFYSSLTDEQKGKFGAATQSPAPSQQKNGRPHGVAQSCTTANAAIQWPEARIESMLRPNEEQQAKLKALQSAATQAAEQLAASCPSEMPTTPTARLAVISKRLDVMLAAVKNVRGAVDDLYADLNDDQKAQFNKIGLARTAEKQS